MVERKKDTERGYKICGDTDAWTQRGVRSGLMKRAKEREILKSPVQHQLKCHMFVLLYCVRCWFKFRIVPAHNYTAIR